MRSGSTISGGGKSSLPIWGKLTLYRRFTLKSTSISYTKSSVRFTPPKSAVSIYPKSAVSIYPKSAVTISPPPKLSNFEQNFERTQHHALLHKGLFCERPIKQMFLFTAQRYCQPQFNISLHRPHPLLASLSSLLSINNHNNRYIIPPPPSKLHLAGSPGVDRGRPPKSTIFSWCTIH